MSGDAAAPRRADHVPEFAHRAEHFRPSPVRAVFELAKRPGTVSLAGGNPDTGVLPHEVIAGMTARILAERGPWVLHTARGPGSLACPD